MTLLLLMMSVLAPAALASDEVAAGVEESDDTGASDEADEVGEDGEDTEEDGGEEEVSEPAPFDLSTAEEAPALDEDTYDFLKPTRDKLPPNPRGQVDFTAYTLEWGEVKVGITNLQVGLLPRVQLGTSPVLAALRVLSLNGKVDAVRAGPVDLAITGRYIQLPQAGFTGTLAGGGALLSTRITPGWSVHGGISGDRVRVGGLPDPTKLPAVLISNSEADLEAWYAAAQDNGLRFDLDAAMVTARVATDVRFNRRDSLVLQGQAMVWHDVMSGLSGVEDLPPVLGVDEWMDVESSGNLPLSDTFVASLSYQATWKQVDLRLGVGLSAVPAAWLLQAFELSYRFGGQTRGEERRLRKGWRRNRDEVGMRQGLGETAGVGLDPGVPGD